MSRRCESHSIPGQRGFSLLEAIVALVLVASVGVALFGWINTNIAALGRIQEVNAKAEATANILEFMHSVNPMQTPQGKSSLGSYRIAWEAKPVTEVVDRRTSLFQFASYETRISVEAEGGRAWFDLNLRQVGFRKVRTLPGAD